jgi:hypothetical protein
MAESAEQEQSGRLEVEQVHVAATKCIANWNVENLMCVVFITNNALIEVDSAPVHTNTLRYERNLGGFGTRGQGTCPIYGHPAIEKWLNNFQKLTAAERRNGHSEWFDLISQECVYQHSKSWDMTNWFKGINPLDDVIDMLKKQNIVAITKCDFDLAALVRGRGLELVCARPEEGWFLKKSTNGTTQIVKKRRKATASFLWP